MESKSDKAVGWVLFFMIAFGVMVEQYNEVSRELDLVKSQCNLR